MTENSTRARSPRSPNPTSSCSSCRNSPTWRRFIPRRFCRSDGLTPPIRGLLRMSSRLNPTRRLLGLPFALLHEALLGGAGKRPAVLAHGFALAGFLRRCVGEVQGQRQRRKQDPLHCSRLPSCIRVIPVVTHRRITPTSALSTVPTAPHHRASGD